MYMKADRHGRLPINTRNATLLAPVSADQPFQAASMQQGLFYITTDPSSTPNVILHSLRFLTGEVLDGGLFSGSFSMV
jgi:hypothetical protein